MDNCSEREQCSDTVWDNAAMWAALKDTERTFTKEELMSFVKHQFFNDALPFDADLVDEVIARVLLLDGNPINEQNMQRERERMISAVLQKILSNE